MEVPGWWLVRTRVRQRARQKGWRLYFGVWVAGPDDAQDVYYRVFQR
jgi:hypothetical protein